MDLMMEARTKDVNSPSTVVCNVSQRDCSSSVLRPILREEHNRFSKRSFSLVVYLFSADNMDKASLSIMFSSPFQLISMLLSLPKLIPAPTNRTIFFFCPSDPVLRIRYSPDKYRVRISGVWICLSVVPYPFKTFYI